MKAFSIIITILNLIATALFIGGIIGVLTAKTSPIGYICIGLGFVVGAISSFISKKVRNRR
jgi:hypothetical protein